MSILLGNGGLRNVKEIYVGVGGSARKVKEGYVGVDGVSRLFYRAAPPLPPIGTTLEQCTWAEIRQIADAGKAAEYFKPGDTKAVHLKGTASKLSLDITYYVYILGFDHNLANDQSAKNTIDFGTWKDEGGKDICLMSGYNDDSDFFMNPKIYGNEGGWKSSHMRYAVLGSTDTEDGDAGASAATDPVANTLMSCLPEDLRAVMKPMTVWTDNTGGRAAGAENVTSTVDYLPLLAEYELFGSDDNANEDEASKQAQYDYYKDGAAAVKYRSDSTGSAVFCWERSPRAYNSDMFCCVGTKGNAGTSSAHYSCGVAPVFRV